MGLQREALIDVAMGYEPVVEYGAWQAPIEDMLGTLTRP